jgi:hypothetical protein
MNEHTVWIGPAPAMERSAQIGEPDYERDARAAYRDLIHALQAGRGTRRPQQRQLLLEVVKEKDRQRGLFG